eukprot:g4781.t1
MAGSTSEAMRLIQEMQQNMSVALDVVDIASSSSDEADNDEIQVNRPRKRKKVSSKFEDFDFDNENDSSYDNNKLNGVLQQQVRQLKLQLEEAREANQLTKQHSKKVEKEALENSTSLKKKIRFLVEKSESSQKEAEKRYKKVNSKLESAEEKMKKMQEVIFALKASSDKNLALAKKSRQALKSCRREKNELKLAKEEEIRLLEWKSRQKIRKLEEECTTLREKKSLLSMPSSAPENEKLEKLGNSDVLQKEVDRLVLAAAEADRQRRMTKIELQRIRSNQENIELLKEEKISLQSKCDRIEKSLELSQRKEHELTQLQSRIKNWNDEISLTLDEPNEVSEKKEESFPNFALFIQRLRALRSENQVLLGEKGEIEAQSITLRNQIKLLEESVKAEKIENKSLQIELNQVKLKLERKEKLCVVLETDQKSQRRMIELYEEAVEKKSVSKDSNVSKHVQWNARIKELESLLDESVATTKLLSKQLESSEFLASKLQTEVGKGMFNRETTKVLHVKSNPAKIARKQFQKDKAEELAGFQAEIGRLQSLLEGKLEDSSAISMSTSKLEENKTGNWEIQYKRLVKVFKKHISMYREAVNLLFGYTLSMEAQSSEPHLNLRSIYSASSEDNLQFKMQKKEKDEKYKLELLHTEMAATFQDEINLYLKRLHSIPGFLSGITTKLLEQTTIAPI